MEQEARRSGTEPEQRGGEGSRGFDPKHRIIGAIVLVTLAVIFLPMLLSKSPSPDGSSPVPPSAESRVVVTEIPPPSATAPAITPPDAVPGVAPPVVGPPPITFGPAPTPPVTPPAVTVAPGRPITPNAAQPTQRIVARPPEPTAAPREPAAKPPARTTKAEGSRPPLDRPADKTTIAKAPERLPDRPSGRPPDRLGDPPPDRPAAKAADKGWIVQAGAFSRPENAREFRDKLNRQGFHAQIDTLSRNGRQIARVRLGPYASRDRANEARDQLRKGAGVNGVIAVYP